MQQVLYPHKNLLCLDGGGVRGLTQLVILDLIEDAYGIDIKKSFDIVAGTSIGSITALLAHYYPLKEAIEKFKEQAPIIFNKPFYKLGLLDERYNNKFLKQSLEKLFGLKRFKDLDSKFMFTAYSIKNRKPVILKSWQSKYKHMTIIDACMASSAAPTYFEAVEYKRDCLIDGGVFANNPALCAYVESRKIRPADLPVILSIGTGQVAKNYEYKKVKDYGLIEWARPLFDIVFSGTSQNVDYILSKLLGNTYCRLQFELDEKHTSLDNVTRENLDYLETTARKAFEKNRYKLKYIKDYLL